jgi:endonuclease/exonuclease/phosphatase family metal-dependent hydrolase
LNSAPARRILTHLNVLPQEGRLPTEPDINAPPAAVSAEVARLDAALDQVIPAKAPGANIVVGTWNLRAFSDLTKGWETPTGVSPKRNFADVTYISRFIRRCDVVAVQEVRGNLRALRYMLKALGEDWAFILTDVTKGSQGNDERLAFLFNMQRVKPSGLACELVVWIEDAADVSAGALDRQFARTPYAVSFQASGQTFILVTLHVNYGKQAADRVPELKAIAEWLAAWAEREFGWDQNVIALGDFNIDRQDDPLYKAFTSTGLTPAAPLVGLRRTIFDTPQAPHYYDQIAWFTKGQAKRPVMNLDCSSGGTFDFVPELQGSSTLLDLSWHISDHFPLWVEFAVPGA